MKKYFNRYPINSKKIYFRKGKNIVSKNKDIFLKKYNVHHCIKILSSDYKLIKKNMNKLTHFNIQYSGHKPGKNYLIVKIDKRGYFDGKVFKEPILSSNNFIIAKCLFVKNNIDYINLKEKFFKHSLSNIKNINTLKKAIKRRYKKSLAHLSDTEKLSLGVAITELKIIKRL
jgi:hypothetical protein